MNGADGWAHEEREGYVMPVDQLRSGSERICRVVSWNRKLIVRRYDAFFFQKSQKSVDLRLIGRGEQIRGERVVPGHNGIIKAQTHPTPRVISSLEMISAFDEIERRCIEVG